MNLRNQLSRGEWVANVQNRFWWHYVYLFSLVIKAGQYILHRIAPEQFPDWQYNHTVRFKDGYVIEMLANGKNTREPVSAWIAKQRRTVKLYQPEAPFRETLDLPYDFWGLPQKMLSYFRRYVLKTGRVWNGTDGVWRNGYDCVEETFTAIGEANPHIALPCMVPLSNKLRYVGTFDT
jgi:hypothetical protein